MQLLACPSSGFSEVQFVDAETRVAWRAAFLAKLARTHPLLRHQLTTVLALRQITVRCRTKGSNPGIC